MWTDIALIDVVLIDVATIDAESIDNLLNRVIS